MRLVLPFPPDTQATAGAFSRAGPPAGAEVLASFTVPAGSAVPAAWRDGGRPRLGFPAAEAVDFLRLERYAPRRRPVTRFLPFHYHWVPSGLRLGIQRVLSWLDARKGRPTFPTWPVDTAADVLGWMEAEARGATSVPRWPGGKSFALALTHDIDTGGGFRRLGLLRREEERRGLRSTWNVVAAHYRLDDGVLRDLAAAGHEIGSHGDNHDNRIAFDEPAAMRRRLEVCRPLVERYAARGFRSPSLLRTDRLFETLPLLFRYDASVPNTCEGLGCCTVFPFRIGSLVELPLTVPEDAHLLFHRVPLADRVAVWEASIERIRRVGGVAVLNTHPDPQFSGNEEGREAYGRIVERIAAYGDAWVTTAGALAEQWAAWNGVKAPNDP